MSAVGSVVLRVMRIEPAGSLDLTHSTERMRMAVASREMRLGEHAARTLDDRALRFPEVKARHAMIPRPEIVSVPIAASLDDALATTARCGHSRLPVYEEDLDHIVGGLVVKQILPLFVRDRAAITTGAARRSFQTAALMSDVFAGPESAPVASPLPRLRRDPFAVAIDIDEYGGIAGRITRADVVDSLLGEAPTAPEIEGGLATLPHGGSYALDGLMTLTEANEVYHLPLGENADVETVGGFVFSQLATSPLRR